MFTCKFLFKQRRGDGHYQHSGRHHQKAQRTLSLSHRVWKKSITKGKADPPPCSQHALLPTEQPCPIFLGELEEFYKYEVSFCCFLSSLSTRQNQQAGRTNKHLVFVRGTRCTLEKQGWYDNRFVSSLSRTSSTFPLVQHSSPPCLFFVGENDGTWEYIKQSVALSTCITYIIYLLFQSTVRRASLDT